MSDFVAYVHIVASFSIYLPWISLFKQCWLKKHIKILFRKMSSVHQEADISRRERREQTEKSQCWCEVTITQNKLCSYVIRPLPVREIIKGYDSPILFPYPPICCNSSYVYIFKPSHAFDQELSKETGYARFLVTYIDIYIIK